MRLKPARRSAGPVQGAWWPRTDQLSVELRPLLAALAPRVGPVERVIYDENSWAPESLRMDLDDRSIALEGARTTSTNQLSVIGCTGRLVLLVVPPYTDPNHAYATVMAASKPDDLSTPDELLGIGPREARDRRFAILAHQRWESEGGAVRHPRNDRSDGEVYESLEARSAQGPQ
ncbi:DUF5994 family protein [Mycolicibacterium gadium]|uniref:DUF5994 family protein n=1 Tax=Mycolicibacterium gadium TaxID=1794 RepID=A0ABT6GL76_MYCGU|nr:DUF5994 family protein [Mycolicibacterium gadium]